MSMELLNDLTDTLAFLTKQQSRGIILTSSSEKVFSAGLDILELYHPNLERFRTYWRTFQNTWIKFYGSSIPIAAAINGHAPAGGCVLAMCSEYRVMLPNFLIGLNETQVGIPVPKFVQANMRNTISSRCAEMALTTGKLFSTDEALKIGLVDDIAIDKYDAVLKCENFIKEFSNVPMVARGLTKNILRRKEVEDLEKNHLLDTDEFLTSLLRPVTQKNIGDYLESLKKK